MCKIFFFSFEFQVRNAVLKTTFNLPAPPIKDMKHNNFYKFQLDWKPVDNVLLFVACVYKPIHCLRLLLLAFWKSE
jgi:hypothetical protein